MQLNKVHGNIMEILWFINTIMYLIGFTVPQFSILSPYIPLFLAVLVFSW